MAIVVEQASEGTLTSLLSQLRSSNNFFLPTLNQRNLQGFLTSHNLRYVQTRLTNFLSRCSPVFALGIVYQNLDPTYPATECVQGLDTGSPTTYENEEKFVHLLLTTSSRDGTLPYSTP